MSRSYGWRYAHILRCGNASCIRLALALNVGLDSRILAQLGIKCVSNSASAEFGQRSKAPTIVPRMEARDP